MSCWRSHSQQIHVRAEAASVQLGRGTAKSLPAHNVNPAAIFAATKLAAKHGETRIVGGKAQREKLNSPTCRDHPQLCNQGNECVWPSRLDPELGDKGVREARAVNAQTRPAPDAPGEV